MALPEPFYIACGLIVLAVLVLALWGAVDQHFHPERYPEDADDLDIW